MPGQKRHRTPATANKDGPPARSEHDALNRDIIAILQQDGRTAYSTIASRLGVSEGAVRKRVNRLQETDALRVVAVLDPLALSYDAYTMLGIRVAASAQPEAVAQRLSECPEVVYAIWVSGPYDLLIEVVFEEKERFVTYLAEHIYGHLDIMTCDVMQNLRVVKNQYHLKPEPRQQIAQRVAAKTSPAGAPT